MALNVNDARAYSVLKSLVAFVIYAAFLPVLLLVGQHAFMKYLIKACDHLGKLMAFCGINISSG